jgi:hypothetical protein
MRLSEEGATGLALDGGYYPRDFLLKVVARDTSHENQLTQRLTGDSHRQRCADAADDPDQPSARRRTILIAGHGIIGRLLIPSAP